MKPWSSYSSLVLSLLLGMVNLLLTLRLNSLVKRKMLLL